MRGHTFWDDYAKAMELTIEGNKAITREFSQFLAARWRAMVRAIAQELSELTNHRNLPPV